MAVVDCPSFATRVQETRRDTAVFRGVLPWCPAHRWSLGRANRIDHEEYFQTHHPRGALSWRHGIRVLLGRRDQSDGGLEKELWATWQARSVAPSSTFDFGCSRHRKGDARLMDDGNWLLVGLEVEASPPTPRFSCPAYSVLHIRAYPAISFSHIRASSIFMHLTCWCSDGNTRGPLDKCSDPPLPI